MLSRRVPITVENVHEARALGDWQIAIKYAKKLIPKDAELCQLVEIEGEVEIGIMNTGINLDILKHRRNDERRPSAGSVNLSYSTEKQMNSRVDRLTSLYSNSSIGLDARLLAIKCMFMSKDVKRLLDEIGNDQLDRISSKLKSLQNSWHGYRLSSMLADAFCFKGILLDSTDDDKICFAGPNADIAFQQFSKSTELAVDFMTELSNQIVQSSISRPAGSTLGSQVTDEAMRRIPIYHITKNNINGAISSLRRFITELNQKLTQTIRKTIIAQYATTMFSYIRQANFGQTITIPFLPELNSSTPYFQPSTADEETFLALEDARFTYIDVAVIDEFPENEEVRQNSRQTAFHTIDMHTLFCARFGMFENIVESYEEALKISFQNAEAWFSYGLSLMASKNYYKAYLVMKECSAMEDCDLNVHLMLAQICIDHLALYAEAVNILNKMIDESPQDKKCKAFVYRSISRLYQHMEYRKPKQENQALLVEARNDIDRAKEIDPFDCDVLYFDAYISAVERKVGEASKKVDFMISELVNDKYALKLKLLILTMEQEYEKALELAEEYVKENSGDISDFDFWTFKIYILCASEVWGYDTAIKKFLETIDRLCIGETCDDLKVTEDLCNEKMLTPMPMKDLHSPSVTSRCDCFRSVRSAVQDIWLLAAELYIETNKLDDAKRCVDEAIAINQKSADNYYMLGRIDEKADRFDEALAQYKYVLSYQPDHTEAGKRAARILLNHKKEMYLSVQYCRNALTVDESDFETWHIYSLALHKQGFVEDSLKCIERAVDLESTTGLVSVKSLCRPLKK